MHSSPARHSMVMQFMVFPGSGVCKLLFWANEVINCITSGAVSVTRTTGPSNTLYRCKEVSHNRNGQFTMTHIRVEEGILQEEHSLLTSL